MRLFDNRPEVMVLGSKRSAFAYAMHMMRQQKKIYSVHRYRSYQELTPMRGHRPALIVITHDADQLPEYEEMLGYLPSFDRGSIPMPVLHLDQRSVPVKAALTNEYRKYNMRNKVYELYKELYPEHDAAHYHYFISSYTIGICLTQSEVEFDRKGYKEAYDYLLAQKFKK